MSFALTEAILLLATLLPAFRLDLRAGYVPRPTLRITLRPAAGMPMRLARRTI
jgi:cytochrome P450